MSRPLFQRPQCTAAGHLVKQLLPPANLDHTCHPHPPPPARTPTDAIPSEMLSTQGSGDTCPPAGPPFLPPPAPAVRPPMHCSGPVLRRPLDRLHPLLAVHRQRRGRLQAVRCEYGLQRGLHLLRLPLQLCVRGGDLDSCPDHQNPDPCPQHQSSNPCPDY